MTGMDGTAQQSKRAARSDCSHGNVCMGRQASWQATSSSPLTKAAYDIFSTGEYRDWLRPGCSQRSPYS